MDVFRADVHCEARPEEIEPLQTLRGVPFGEGGHEPGQCRVEFGMIVREESCFGHPAISTIEKEKIQ